MRKKLGNHVRISLYALGLGFRLLWRGMVGIPSQSKERSNQWSF